jgi:hypothetical protein
MKKEIGLNNFKEKWANEEPTVRKTVWQFCRRASERDK